jgi:hypothetical protein
LLHRASQQRDVSVYTTNDERGAIASMMIFDFLWQGEALSRRCALLCSWMRLHRHVGGRGDPWFNRTASASRDALGAGPRRIGFILNVGKSVP